MTRLIIDLLSNNDVMHQNLRAITHEKNHHYLIRQKGNNIIS